MNPRYEDYSFILNFSGTEPELLLINQQLFLTEPLEPHFWQTCEPVNRAVALQYAIEAITLRCLARRYQPDRVVSVYAQEFLGGRLPNGAHWITRERISTLTSSPFTIDELLGWFDSITSNHPLRRAWYRPGWFAHTTADLSIHALGAITQMRSWERSTLLRIPGAGGNFYYKGVPAMFAYEPALTAWLAREYADCTPAVSAFGADWLLMPDYGGVPLTAVADEVLWADAMRVYARLQINIAPRCFQLLALGVPDRGLNWIEQQIDSLLLNEAPLRVGNNPLTPDEIVKLQALVPALHEACALLQRSSIPETLEHGDLWDGQIIVRDRQPVITDWSDAAITFPFFSLSFFTAEIPIPVDPIRRAYLDEWQALSPDVEALEASARLLSPVYSALRYYVDILPQMENQWEMENMLAYNLRLLLKTNEM
ncbi:MAG: hypothetical protein ABI700_29510 [Chloroflexota bacterium]